jgi:hypothetical protein
MMPRPIPRDVLPAVLAGLSACASSPAIPPPRFVNAAPVAVVNDRLDVPRPPAERKYSLELYHFDAQFFRLLTRPLELPAPQRARGVNALDEVPASTWFTPRIGVRELSPDEIRRGVEISGSPEPHMPWRVLSTKAVGVAVGFLIEDARGQKWLIKFEDPRFPEVETAADVIVSRLLWAAGYNVPEDHVVYVRADQLELASNATAKNRFGTKKPLTRAELDRQLASVSTEPDGRMRALASRFLDGKVIGGHPQSGVRSDDPNDVIPHELRRDLRGMYPLFAWLDHVDVKEDNTLDVWVADPAVPSVHYVKHYLVDFGVSLGTAARIHSDPRDGLEYRLDWPAMFTSLLTFGLAPREWERRPTEVTLRGVGLYDTVSYDPGDWKPFTPAYLPLRTADRFDKFWGAKLVARFTREQLAAAVETARLSDPRSAAYLVDTLVARQQMTAKHWFDRVAPLDQLELVGSTLCFTDLALAYGLASAGPTRHVVTTFSRTGTPTSDPAGLRPTGPRTCTQPVRRTTDPEGYAIVRIETGRPDRIGTTYVHVVREPVPRVIGIWRD